MENRSSELTEENFRRINYINWALFIPMALLFAWPYLYVAQLLSIDPLARLIGSIFFAIPFMTTILHGHVTLALGSAHRHHYYSWLEEKMIRYGFLFHPDLMRTRYRMILLGIGMGILVMGYLFPK